MLAAAKARARKAQSSEAATAPPDSSMQYSRLKIYVEAILEYGVGKLANEIFEQTDGSLPSAAAGMGEATKVSSNVANEEQVAANTAAYTGGSNTSAMIGLMDDFRPRELVARCARRDRELIRSALVSYCKIVEMVQAVAGRGGTFALHIKSSLIVLGGWATAGDVAYDECRLPPGVKFSKEEQNRVVFAVGRRGDIKSLIQTAELQFAKQLVGVAVDNIMEKRGTEQVKVGNDS